MPFVPRRALPGSLSSRVRAAAAIAVVATPDRRRDARPRPAVRPRGRAAAAGREQAAPRHAGIARRVVAGPPRVHRGARRRRRHDEQRHRRPARPGDRGRLVGAVRRRHAAPDVLADQELHVDGGRPGPGRGQVEHRRSGAEVLPRRDAGGRQRLPEGHADPRPAGDVDGPPHRAVVPGQHHVDEDVLRASRAAQAGHDLPLQHAGQLHPLGHRAEGDRPEGSRLPADAALHAARHRHAAVGDQPGGHHASAATACGCAPRTSRASASSICRRASGRASSSCRPTGSPRRRRGRRRTAAARRPTGIRATATSSGARATSRSAATARTASSAWCCRTRTPSSR